MTIAPRILVLARLAEEWSILLGACAERHSTEIVKDLKLPCCYVPVWRMALARGGHGKAQFAEQAQYLISRFPSVTLIVCVGAAGSLDADVSIGDVVVGTESVEHDYRLLFVVRPLPRFHADVGCLTQLRSTAAHRLGFSGVCDPLATTGMF